MSESSAEKRKHRRVARRRPERDPGQELIDQMLSDPESIPDCGDGPPDAQAVYSFAVRQLSILGALCPEYDIRVEALSLLMKEFGTRPSESVDPERRAAFVSIERILEARGIRVPHGTRPGLLELEEVREGSLSDGEEDRVVEEEEP
jgi:hypothetical protein